MEMPFDVLNHRLGKIRDNGDIDFDNTAVAVDIDSELQDKFIFFPIEELEAVEIEDDRGVLNAGSGPEHCAATSRENPHWLYNHGMNALALWWRLKKDQERQAEEEKKLAQRPEPGVYQATHLGSNSAFAVIVTEDRRVVVPMQQGDVYDQSEIFDAAIRGGRPWKIQRINITDGTISA